MQFPCLAMYPMGLHCICQFVGKKQPVWVRQSQRLYQCAPLRFSAAPTFSATARVSAESKQRVGTTLANSGGSQRRSMTKLRQQSRLPSGPLQMRTRPEDLSVRPTCKERSAAQCCVHRLRVDVLGLLEQLQGQLSKGGRRHILAKEAAGRREYSRVSVSGLLEQLNWRTGMQQQWNLKKVLRKGSRRATREDLHKTMCAGSDYSGPSLIVLTWKCR
jgi:hypothetical protein